MNLKELKSHFLSFPEGTIFKFGLSEPFSWRRVYAEVAFDVIKEETTREEILENIEGAYTKRFYGHKGGIYTYSDYTDIHFEKSSSDYTDGTYRLELLRSVNQDRVFGSPEEQLVETLFPNNKAPVGFSLAQENAIWGIIQHICREQCKDPHKIFRRDEVFEMIANEL